MEWKYVKKIKDVNSIKEIENKYSIQLPVYLKNIIIKYNGGRPLNRIFDTNREKEKVMKSLLSYNVEDKENVYFFSDIFERNFIPFAIDGFGNVICINNKNRNVELYNHEMDRFEYVCENIEDFFNNCLYSDE